MLLEQFRWSARQAKAASALLTRVALGGCLPSVQSGQVQSPRDDPRVLLRVGIRYSSHRLSQFVPAASGASPAR